MTRQIINLNYFTATLLSVAVFSCNRNFPYVTNENTYMFKQLNCIALSDLKLSSAQIRTLNYNTRALFGTKENLANFCYLYRVNINNSGLVEAFNFSSHQSKFLFLFNRTKITVLQSEQKPLSLRASFEEKVKLFKNDFEETTVERMRQSIETYVKE